MKVLDKTEINNTLLTQRNATQRNATQRNATQRNATRKRIAAIFQFFGLTALLCGGFLIPKLKAV